MKIKKSKLIQFISCSILLDLGIKDPKDRRIKSFSYIFVWLFWDINKVKLMFIKNVQNSPSLILKDLSLTHKKYALLH